MASHPIKMRLTANAVTDLEALGLILGEPSAALMARRIILSSLRLGTSLGDLPPIPTRPQAPPSDALDPMVQIVMRLDDAALSALDQIALERGLDSAALAARAVLADAMRREGLTNASINPVERTRRATDGLSPRQSEAIRLLTRIVILLDQCETAARKWSDPDILARAQLSRSCISTAMSSLRKAEPIRTTADAIRATGYLINTIARALQAGDPLARFKTRLTTLLDELDSHVSGIS